MLFIGIRSLLTVNESMPSTPRRTTPSTTFVPFGPRRRRIMSSLDIFTPAIAVSFTITMRSPACMPTFSDGPFTVGCMTSSVSSTMLNCTPMPSKLPSRGSFIAFTSFGSEYDECGSRFSSMPRMASSTSLFSSTESTYRLFMASSAIWSLRSGLSFSMLMRNCENAASGSTMANKTKRSLLVVISLIL